MPKFCATLDRLAALRGCDEFVAAEATFGRHIPTRIFLGEHFDGGLISFLQICGTSDSHGPGVGATTIAIHHVHACSIANTVW